MATLAFKPWPKTPRLFRDVIITEKIDGTNAAVQIVARDNYDPTEENTPNHLLVPNVDGVDYMLSAQSRNRTITPGKTSDNYGFAAWAFDNAAALIASLGEGTHYGEWWGSGVARKYDLTGADKRFSLFDADRYAVRITAEARAAGLGTVPVLYRGPFDSEVVSSAVQYLRTFGSVAAPGFPTPEGVIVYHTAARHGFKVLLDNDALPKGAAA